jgi:branched-chain amino acid transport system substrate-binding protein
MCVALANVSPDILRSVKKRPRILALLVFSLVAPGVFADEYVVLILSPLSGEWRTLGESTRNGIALALEQAEDRGRFREGVRLSLKEIDDNARPEELATRTEKQVRDNDAILVIGPTFSPQAEQLAASAKRHTFPMLTAAVSEGITIASPWAFRSGASPHRLIEGMVRGTIANLNPRKVAVVFQEGNPGYESQARTVAKVGAQMGRLVVGEVAIADGQDAFSESAEALKTVAPDVIFFCMDAEPAAVVASRLRRAGISKATQLVFGPTAAQPALLEVGGDSVEGAIVVTDYLPEIPGEQNSAFVTAYRERYGRQPDRWAGIGYATGLIAAEAIRNAGPAPTRALVRESMERNTKLTLPLGQSAWSMGIRHEPLYSPAFFSITGGAFVPMKVSP